MKIKINQFNYTAPKVNPKALAPSQSQIAHNCDLESGVIMPVRGLKHVVNITKPGAIRSIYKMDDKWLAWTGDVDVVKAQILDSDGMVFFTGDGHPKVTNKTLGTSGAGHYPIISRRLGIIPPTEAPIIEIQGTGDTKPGRVIAYFYTYVDEFGFESQPSPTTAVVTLEGNQYTRIKNIVKPALAATSNDIKFYRLYRLVAGNYGAEYQMVKVRPHNLSGTLIYDIPVDMVPTVETYMYDANSQTGPTNLNDHLGEVCPTEGWARSPEDPPTFMKGLAQFQNGIMAAFYKNQVVVSEPLIPYAYPTRYFRPTDNDIVGVGVFQNNLIALTHSYPYVVSGYDPDSMMIERLPYKRACKSKRGIVSTAMGVVFPSQDGLCIITQANENLITQALYKKEQWNAFELDKFVSVFYTAKYFAFTEGTGNAIVIDFNEPGVSTLALDQKIYGSYIDPVDDALYLLVETNGVYSIQAYNADDKFLTYTWKSKRYETPNYTNFSCGKIVGKQTILNPIIFKLYADGVLKETQQISDNEPFRLKSGYTAREWELQVEGNVEIHSIAIATSVEEIKNE